MSRVEVSTVNSVGGGPLPASEKQYGGPESLRSPPEVVLHGLSDLQSYNPIGLLHSYFWGPTGQKDLKGLLLHLVSIPHCRCPAAGLSFVTSLW